MLQLSYEEEYHFSRILSFQEHPSLHGEIPGLIDVLVVANVHEHDPSARRSVLSQIGVMARDVARLRVGVMVRIFQSDEVSCAFVLTTNDADCQEDFLCTLEKEVCRKFPKYASTFLVGVCDPLEAAYAVGWMNYHPREQPDAMEGYDLPRLAFDKETVRELIIHMMFEIADQRISMNLFLEGAVRLAIWAEDQRVREWNEVQMESFTPFLHPDIQEYVSFTQVRRMADLSIDIDVHLATIWQHATHERLHWLVSNGNPSSLQRMQFYAIAYLTEELNQDAGLLQGHNCLDAEVFLLSQYTTPDNLDETNTNQGTRTEQKSLFRQGYPGPKRENFRRGPGGNKGKK